MKTALAVFLSQPYRRLEAFLDSTHFWTRVQNWVTADEVLRAVQRRQARFQASQGLTIDTQSGF